LARQLLSNNRPPGVVYRFRITITIGPTDSTLLDVMRWMLPIIMRTHDNPPGPVTLKVEPIDRTS
jgi:hypothetical protein